MIRTAIFILLVTYAIALTGQVGSTIGPPGSASITARRIRVAGGVMNGLVEQRALPIYPSEALDKGIHGEVIFQVMIDETGKIVLSRPVTGEPLLVASSVEALKTYRFRQYLLQGTPIIVESQIGFEFSLKRKGNNKAGKVEYMSTIPYREEFRTGAVTGQGSLILWPRKISGDEPQIPPELTGRSGSVYLTVVVGADGKVQDVHLVGGDEAFVPPVIEAVRKFTYEPQLIGDKPTAATIQVSYHFGNYH